MNLVNFFSLEIWGGGFLPRAGRCGCGFAVVGRGDLSKIPCQSLSKIQVYYLEASDEGFQPVVG